MQVTACLPTAMLGVASLPANAQESPLAREFGEDLVVTAQRRGQRTQSVPVAVTVLSAQRIEGDAIANLDRIGADVPNLYLARNFGTSSGVLVVLRGVEEGDSHSRGRR